MGKIPGAATGHTLGKIPGVATGGAGWKASRPSRSGIRGISDGGGAAIFLFLVKSGGAVIFPFLVKSGGAAMVTMVYTVGSGSGQLDKRIFILRVTW